MAHSEAPTVVFAGDSITASGDWSAWLPDMRTVNLAVPGDTTADLRARITDLAAARPDLLVVLIGTNDFGGLDRLPDEVADDVLEVVQELRSTLHSTRILLQTIMPRGREWTARIRRTNAALAAGATRIDVACLDTWPALAAADGSRLDPRYLLPDGFDVHLNEAGYAAWLAALEPALRSLQQGTRPGVSMAALRHAACAECRESGARGASGH